MSMIGAFVAAIAVLVLWQVQEPAPECGGRHVCVPPFVITSFLLAVVSGDCVRPMAGGHPVMLHSVAIMLMMT